MEKFTEFFKEEILSIWIAGGSLMIPLAILAGITYFAIVELLVYLRRHNYFTRSSDLWAHWIEKPEDATGHLGTIIRYAQYDVSDDKDVRSRVDEMRSVHLPRLSSRMQYAAILVSAAPLTGLLGTVVGMLATFGGLSTSSGANTIDVVAGGISEALITTQTGLVLAIPGYVMITVIKKKLLELETFFLQIEVLTIKYLGKKKMLSQQVS